MEVKTVSVETTITPEGEAPKPFENKPRRYILTNLFKVVRAPEQKKSKKGPLYFNLFLEQEGQFLQLPAKWIVGKYLRELGFREYPNKPKNSAFNIYLNFEYTTYYFAKEKKVDKVLWVTDFKEENGTQKIEIMNIEEMLEARADFKKQLSK